MLVEIDPPKLAVSLGDKLAGYKGEPLERRFRGAIRILVAGKRGPYHFSKQETEAGFDYIRAKAVEAGIPEEIITEVTNAFADFMRVTETYPR